MRFLQADLGLGSPAPGQLASHNGLTIVSGSWTRAIGRRPLGCDLKEHRLVIVTGSLSS